LYKVLVKVGKVEEFNPLFGYQLNKWIVLPFDNDTRALLESDITTSGEGNEIDYELDPICHTYVKDRV
ncbi:hypothetical protein LCGC14_3106250, partial [marine sediment metagenome]